MTQEIVYSHRPAAGISVAATNDGSRLLVAFAMVNDGTSRNGVIWKERRDSFSRIKARQILNGRLEAARVALGDVPMTIIFDDTNLSARSFMAALRTVFKPTADESDTTFSDVDVFDGREFRYRDRAENIFRKAVEFANGVVADSKVNS